ncbi:MAG: hypothetical protein KAZ36_01265, partial [Bacteroidales bacterium]|nr:hypothetical protein [Bacteroidales bacterium]
LLPLFYHGQHSGTVFLSDHNFLPAKVGTIMPEKKMLVAVGIQRNWKSKQKKKKKTGVHIFAPSFYFKLNQKQMTTTQPLRK